MVRREETAEDSFAEILARSKLGMAMAAMIRMIATTISNSIREKPRCLFIVFGTRESTSISVLTADAQETERARCQLPVSNVPVLLQSRALGALIGDRLIASCSPVWDGSRYKRGEAGLPPCETTY